METSDTEYREQVLEFDEEWQSFRQELPSEHQPVFDQVVAKMHDFEGAGAMQGVSDWQTALLLSVLLGQQIEINELQQEVCELEEELTEGSMAG